MTTQLGTVGDVAMALCASTCERCRSTVPQRRLAKEPGFGNTTAALSIAGPHGHITLCAQCLVYAVNALMKDELGIAQSNPLFPGL